MRTLTWTLLLLFFITEIFSQITTSDKNMMEALDEKVPLLMQENAVPGLALAVIDNGQILLRKGYGFANLEEESTILTSTGFNIGSISKLFTATAIMKLAEDGKIDLDAPVQKYLTRWNLPESNFDANKVTIRSILSHTAGISVHGYPGFTNKTSLPTLEASLNGNNGPAKVDEKVELILAPQTEFKYSGGGYTILQLLIEEVTEMPFEKFMKKTIFKPLKMKSTSFKISKRMLKNSAIPYDKNKKALPFEYFTAQAAAGLQTTLDDFILFVADLLHHHSIISEKTIRTMVAPTEVSKGKYGIGFMMLKFGPLELKGHAGSNTGFQSGFFMDFNTKSGLIMMTNGDKGDKTLKKIIKTWASFKYKK